jgi:dihydrofolate reductase
VEGRFVEGVVGGYPPYHTPVFVLTHHARSPLAMEGSTTFYFVADGLESALQKAKEAAKGKDVRIGGGVSVIRQYLIAGQIDEMHLAVSPVLLGEGENLFSGINLPQLGFTPFRTVPGEGATHVFIKKR